ncbi:MAG TPA: rod-binding protein [Candidatus Gastranaerophilales bacterium]|nr:rod-binding protein [Candidatus Gastranaerophilales bacterium]
MLESPNIQATDLNIQQNKINELSNINFKDKKQEDLMNAAAQFEAVFLNQMFKALDATIERDEDAMFSGGRGEQMFKSMFYDEIAKDISSNPSTSFGFAKQIYEQMKNIV